MGAAEFTARTILNFQNNKFHSVAEPSEGGGWATVETVTADGSSPGPVSELLLMIESISAV